MCASKFIYLILIFSLSIDDATSTMTYRFIPTTRISDTEEESNYWDCVNGPRVLDNEDELVAVYLADNWKINEEVRLPLTTEIIMGEDSAIFDKDEDEIECEGKKQSEPSVKYWHDPNNWDIIEDNKTNIVRFIHAEKIPDENVVAYFVPDATYFVTLNIAFRVGSIYVGDYPYSTENFIAHMASVEGGLQFKQGKGLMFDEAFDPVEYLSNSVVITETECTDKRGCVNSNLGQRVRFEICAHVSCPSSIPCQTKFQPIGHCCNLCGAMITFKVDDNFLLEKLTAVQIYVVNKYPQLWMSVLKTQTDSFQVVLIYKDPVTFNIADLEPAVRDVNNAVKYDLPGILKETVTVMMSENLSSLDTVALVLTLLCLLLILIGVSLVILKRRTTLLNWVTTERLTMRASWRGKQDDEMLLELSEPSTSSKWRKKGTQSKPSAFKELLEREKIESVMGTKEKTKTEQSLTYPNPVFESTYEEVE